MKKGKIKLITLCISLLLLISSSHVLAEQRSIFVGDLINIKVITNEYTEDELKDKFNDFEVVDIKTETDGYTVTIRTFEVGKKTIKIDNKEIEIEVKSTLKEIQEDGVYDGDLNIKENKFSFEFKYVLYILICIFIISIIILLYRIIKRRRKKELTAYKYFINQTKNIILNNHECFVEMTRLFKQYLESTYSCSIKGKTCNEIIVEISQIQPLQIILSEVEEWLRKSDYYKFTGIKALMEQKQELLEELIVIVNKIEEIKEVKK
ncbi:MAG: hypothetical protein N4A63_17510 [Vallitalea sp.]|jgi:RNA recognition motif-containing protein|nr:hypothetical protein [Vallitalea sp.]